jgi:DNA-binding NtrC family response regulator
MPRERWPQMLAELDAIGIKTWPAETCHEARRLLENRPRVDVVISDLSLADGNWCDVFKHLVDTGSHASMIVTTRQADERLWSEVLWRGAYDLLLEPYEKGHVRRVVEGAIRASQGAGTVRPIEAGRASEIAIETVAAASH